MPPAAGHLCERAVYSGSALNFGKECLSENGNIECARLLDSQPASITFKYFASLQATTLKDAILLILRKEHAH